MTIIRQQNAIDIYANKDDRSVTICEEKGFFNEHEGSYEDIFVNIDVAHIDTVIEALQKAKEEIFAHDTKKD